MAVDESMVKHKGRSRFVQYMPAKPTRWGLKVWVLAESVTGYVVHAIPYFSREDRTPFRIYEDVVLKMLTSANVLGLFHHVYFDNFYTSVPMFEELAVKFKTFCCGTVRRNRKELPKDLMVKKHSSLQNRGEGICSQCVNLMLFVWKDRKIIHVLSTIHGTIMSTCQQTLRDDVSGKFCRKDIPCPVAVRDYSKFMGGVDLADQMFQYYSFARKSRKWTKKLFWYVLEVMKLNSYTLFNSLQTRKISFYDFSLHLVKQMIASTTYTVPQQITYPNQPTHRLTSRCMPSDLGRKSFCKVCYRRSVVGTRDKRRQTKYGCKDCNAHLCLPECFTVFHNVENFAHAVLQVDLDIQREHGGAEE